MISYEEFLNLRVISKRISIWAVGIWWCALFGCEARPVIDYTTFEADPVVTVYVVMESREDNLSIEIRNGRQRKESRVTLRVFDPAENILRWRYADFGVLRANDLGPTPSEIRIQEEPPEPGQILVQEHVGAASRGIYQIRVAANDQVHLKLGRTIGAEFCAYGGNGTLHAWSPAKREGYVYIPEGAEVLRIAGTGFRAVNERGDLLVSPSEQPQAIAIKDTGVVWKLEFTALKTWYLRTAGFPFLVCTSLEMAKAVHASTETTRYGTRISHKFQVTAEERIRELLSEVNETQRRHTGLTSVLQPWNKDPIRGKVVAMGFLPMIESIVQSQNTNPTSPWGGSIDGWQKFSDKEGITSRSDRFCAIKGLYAGLSSDHDGRAHYLALAATYDDPVNPYFGRKDLLSRATAAALRDLMALGEDETWPGVAELNPYPGFMAFPSGQKTFPVYAVAAPRMTPEIRKVWTDGLGHIVDRHVVSDLVSTRNQSAHYLVALEAFGSGSNDERYKFLAKLYRLRWVNGMNPAGYYEEKGGADGSYIGITHWFEAVAYRMSADPLLLQSLRSTYAFFNYTLAPEPDGSLIGGFNFNYRMGEGFNIEQWGGAKGIVDDVVPELAPLLQRPATASHSATGGFRNKKGQLPRFPAIQTPRTLWYSEFPSSDYVLPALEPSSFFRNPGKLIVAVRKKGYYGYLWNGRESSANYMSNRREKLRILSPSYGSKASPVEIRRIAPFLGGGLSGLWIEHFGHVILAANWAPEVHHGIVARKKNGKAYWEDATSIGPVSTDNRSIVEFSGRIETLPLEYSRTYQFLDNQIVIEITLTPTHAIELLSLAEYIPVPAWITVQDIGQDSAAGLSLHRPGVTKSIEIQTDGGRKLYPPKREFKGVPGKSIDLRYLQIDLPASLRAREEVTLRYRINLPQAHGER